MQSKLCSNLGDLLASKKINDVGLGESAFTVGIEVPGRNGPHNSASGPAVIVSISTF
jgi:hypothetical protein